MPRPFHRAGFAARSAGQRRSTQWGASADITGPTALAANTAILDQAFTQANLDTITPATIIRTRGILWVSTDQLTASEEPFGAMGMMVVTEAARVAGIAAIPTPIAEEVDDGFFVFQYFGGPQLFFSATGQQQWARYEFDSKAQRKMNSDEAIVVTLENASSSAGLNYLLKFRILFKLAK